MIEKLQNMAENIYYLKRLYHENYASRIRLLSETVIRRECSATDIPHLKSPRISRSRHCVIYVEGQQLFIMCEARNGTFLNSNILQKFVKVPLKLGDQISLGVPPDQHGEDCYQYEVMKDNNNVVIELGSDNEDETIGIVDKNDAKEENTDLKNKKTDRNANDEEISIERPKDAKISAFIDLDSGDEEDAPAPSPTSKRRFSTVYSKVYPTISLLDDEDDENVRVPEQNEDDDDVIFIGSDITQENMNFLLSQTSLYRIKEERIDEDSSRDSFDNYNYFNDNFETNNNIPSVQKDYLVEKEVSKEKQLKLPKKNQWFSLKEARKLNGVKQVKLLNIKNDQRYKTYVKDYERSSRDASKRIVTRDRRSDDKFKPLKDAKAKTKKRKHEDVKQSETKRTKVEKEFEPILTTFHKIETKTTPQRKIEFIDARPIPPKRKSDVSSSSKQKSKEIRDRDKPSTSSSKTISKPSTSRKSLKTPLDFLRASSSKDLQKNNGYYNGILKDRIPTKPKVKLTAPKIKEFIPDGFVPNSQMIIDNEPIVPKQPEEKAYVAEPPLHVIALKGDRVYEEETKKDDKIEDVSPNEAEHLNYHQVKKMTFNSISSNFASKPSTSKSLPQNITQATGKDSHSKNSKSRESDSNQKSTSKSGSIEKSKHQPSSSHKTSSEDSRSKESKIKVLGSSHKTSNKVGSSEEPKTAPVPNKGISKSMLKTAILLASADLPDPERKKPKSILKRRESSVSFNPRVEEHFFEVQPDISKDINGFENKLVTEITGWKFEWFKNQEALDKCPINRMDHKNPLALSYKNSEEYERILLPILKMEMLHGIFVDWCKHKDKHLPLQVTELMEIKQFGESYKLTLRIAYSTDYSVNFGELVVLSFKYSYLEYKILGFVIMKRGSNSELEKSYIITIQTAKNENSDLLHNQCFDFNIEVLSYLGSELSHVKGLFYLRYADLSKYILRPAENIKSTTGNYDLKDLGFFKLNDSQSKAISEICNRWKKKETGVTLIEGPPGTGKSATISNAIIQLLCTEQSRRPKILVCAESNQAVDIIMKELHKFSKTDQKNFTMARHGMLNRMSPIAYSHSIHEWAKKGAYRQLKSERGLKTEFPDYQLYKRWGRLRVLLDPKNTATPQSARPALHEEYSKLDKELNNKILKEFEHPSKIKLYKTLEKAQSREIVNSYDIICTTLSSCNTLFKEYSHKLFDICIVDEATQASELAILLPLQFNMKMLVLVGDTQQLPNMVLSQNADKLGYKRSIFARIIDSFSAIDKSVSIQLNVQYRMHPEILKWPNRYFYKNTLKTDDILIKEYDAMDLTYKPYNVFNLLDADQNMTQTAFNYYNYNEIEFVTQILEKMMEDYRPDKSYTYGIITPYARQRTEFENVLKNRSIKDVSVTSIDSCQGQERDVIIISVARTQGTGFLIHPQRLNVALTRAKKCLILCGNFNSLYSNDMWKNLLNDAENRGCLHNLNECDITTENVLSKLYRK